MIDISRSILWHHLFGPCEEADAHLRFQVPAICDFDTESILEIWENFSDGGILFLNYFFLRKDYIL